MIPIGNSVLRNLYGRLKVVFQTILMLSCNRIIKEPILLTTSKNGLRPSEKQKPRACHIHPTSGLKVLCGLQLVTRTNYCIICCFNFWSKEFSRKIKSCLLNNPLSFSNTFLSNNKIFCIKGSFSGNSFLFII